MTIHNFSFKPINNPQPFAFLESKKSIRKNIFKTLHTQENKDFLEDFLTPLNPIHGGIGFMSTDRQSNSAVYIVKAVNYLSPKISKKNRDIVHTGVFINDNKIIEATPRYKNYNGINSTNDAKKVKMSIYVSKFPLLNVMINQEIEKLTGGSYNFIGTVNCIPKVKIFPKIKENDYFCSQMLLKALKNALERYQKTPLLNNKEDIKKISDALEHLDPDFTLPAEIKETLDTLPEYFMIKKFTDT